MAVGLILKLVTLRHGLEALRATQDLIFKSTIAEFFRRHGLVLIPHCDVKITQLLHVIVLSREQGICAAIVVGRNCGRCQSKILLC